jgi:hypothetical protein
MAFGGAKQKLGKAGDNGGEKVLVFVCKDEKNLNSQAYKICYSQFLF